MQLRLTFVVWYPDLFALLSSSLPSISIPIQLPVHIFVSLMLSFMNIVLLTLSLNVAVVRGVTSCFLLCSFRYFRDSYILPAYSYVPFLTIYGCIPF